MDNYKVAKELAEVLSQRKACREIFFCRLLYQLHCKLGTSAGRTAGKRRRESLRTGAGAEGLRGKVRKQLDPRGLR